MLARDRQTNQFKKIFVKALDSLPVGASIEYAGDTIPAEMEGTWMFERGQEVNRTEYADLFSRIGTRYGAGNGTTTFNLPNRCGRVAVGLDTTDTDFDTIGETGGSKYLQEHNHSFVRAPLYGAEWSGAQNALAQNTSAGPSIVATTNNAGTGDSGNLQPYIVKNYIIKVKETTPRSSETVNTFSNSTKDAYACNYANNTFQTKGTILWTNANPTSDFAAQNITVDLSNYDSYEIVYYSSKGDLLVHTTGVIPKIGNGTKLFMLYNALSNHFITSRQVSIISSGLGFYDAIFRSFTANDEGTANNRLIPLYIIGHNTGLFS